MIEKAWDSSYKWFAKLVAIRQFFIVSGFMECPNPDNLNFGGGGRHSTKLGCAINWYNYIFVCGHVA